AVDEVDLGAADRQPGPAVDDAAPLAWRKDPARPAQRNDVRWVEAAAVVEPETPVRTPDSRAPRPRPPEGDRHNPRDRGQLRSEVLHGTSIVPLVPAATGPARPAPLRLNSRNQQVSIRPKQANRACLGRASGYDRSRYGCGSPVRLTADLGCRARH